jgi:hypothetical protein
MFVIFPTHQGEGSLAALWSAGAWLRIGLYVLPFLLGAALTWWLMRRSDKLSAAQAADLGRRQAEWEQAKSNKMSTFGLADRQAQVSAQREQIEARLSERMTQEIRSAINRRTDPSYSPVLDVERPRGFGEVSDGRFSIYTPARKRLEFLLDNLSGASIGIAGSRGAGKTTLLRNFCGPERIVDNLKGKPVLGILTSAPVAYQARDFLLYLFSTTCQSVIEAEGGRFAPPVIAEDLVSGPDTGLCAVPEMQQLPVALIRFGAGLLAVGLTMSLLLAALPGPGRSAGANAQATAPAAVASNASTQASLPAPASVETPAPGKSTPTPTTSPHQDVAPPADASGSGPAIFAGRWADAVKADPGKLLSWGTTFVVLGLLVGSVVRSSALLTLVAAMPMLGLQNLAFVRRAMAREWEAAQRRIHPTPPEPEPDSMLWSEATAWLRTIKFQQSFTSGWSGSLKLPVGLEGGVNRAITLAQNQLSLPEIGYFFARFIERASVKYQIIIGIDELDKLASDDLARQFINDIKSIFGLQRCFYLVSVSENAMSSFERRGLPFRDEFDSAFDELIYVDHLKFGLATKLLEQRILGRPVPFFAVSYCMSGGLPRDLIRNFRNILEISKDQSALSAICDRLMTEDIIAKARAIGTSVRKVSLEPQVDRFLEALHRVELCARSDRALEGEAGSMLHANFLPDEAAEADGLHPQSGQPDGKPEPSSPVAANGDAEAQLQQLRNLAKEIATYILFIIALRRFFNDNLSRDELVGLIDSGDIDRLAEARRYLGVNPAITRSTIRAFYESHIDRQEIRSALDANSVDERSAACAPPKLRLGSCDPAGGDCVGVELPSSGVTPGKSAISATPSH